MLRNLIVLALFASCAHQSHLHLLHKEGIDGQPLGLGPRAKRYVRGAKRAVEAERLPSTATLRFLSLTYKNLMADYYWLRCIDDYGDSRMKDAHYPNLWPLLSRVQGLDPEFVAPYLFAGNVVTLQDMPWHKALSMLETGMQKRPDSWPIALSYGFNMYVLGQDLGRAAQALAQAAHSAEAPPFLASLAVRMAAAAGEPELGLTMVDMLLADSHDAAQTDILRARRRSVLLEVQLKKLNAAARRYRARHGHSPPDLQALVDSGDVPGIGLDAFDGAFFIDADGQINSPNAHRRLRLGKLQEAQGTDDAAH